MSDRSNSQILQAKIATAVYDVTKIPIGSITCCFAFPGGRLKVYQMWSGQRAVYLLNDGNIFNGSLYDLKSFILSFQIIYAIFIELIEITQVSTMLTLFCP